MAASSAGSSVSVNQHGLGSDGMQPHRMWDTWGQLSIHLPVCASVHPSMCVVNYLSSHYPYIYSSSIHSFHLPIHPPIHSSFICPSFTHHHRSILPSTYPSIHPFIWPSMHLLFIIHPSIHSFTHLSIIYLSIHISIHPSSIVCPSIHSYITHHPSIDPCIYTSFIHPPIIHRVSIHPYTQIFVYILM